MSFRSRVAFNVLLACFVGAGVLPGCGDDATFCEGAACGVVDGGGDGDVVVGPHDASSDGPVTDASKLMDGAMGDGATEAGSPTCNKSADPKDSPACVADADGIFVDAAGLDTNAGTKEAPVKSITKAVALAQGGVGRVYVCAGSYAETVSLTAAVSVYGGFACGTYAYSGVLPVVTAAAGQSALLITGVTDVTVEDMQFVSVDASGTDASGNGNSSIAAFVSSSTGVTFKRSTFKAGAGATAAAGATTGTRFATPAPMGSPGTAGGGGAALGPFTCTNGSGKTNSGKGGDPSSGGSGGTMGSSDPAISPVFPTGDDGAPGGLNCGTAAAHGGSYGAAGGGGTPATLVGSLTAGSWAPTSGGVGSVGGVGRGWRWRREHRHQRRRRGREPWGLRRRRWKRRRRRRWQPWARRLQVVSDPSGVDDSGVSGRRRRQRRQGRIRSERVPRRSAGVAGGMQRRCRRTWRVGGRRRRWHRRSFRGARLDGHCADHRWRGHEQCGVPRGYHRGLGALSRGRPGSSG